MMQDYKRNENKLMEGSRENDKGDKRKDDMRIGS